ncbi:MAG TPA: aminotransferase class I/II-fold pyridoxal phosphate-dependent enzyme [Acidimicrobiales bacterium]|nr:aminotransferase class I/II-fold pyridoxal phosphate-dependent enzyme [Acidimicrobiales bacterium]
MFDDFTPDTLRRRGTIKWSKYEPDVLACWVAEMDFATAPPVRRAALEAVEREEFGYPRSDETNGLREAVADFQRSRYGWNVDRERVHTLPDVLKGVELAIRHFSPEGSAVILSTPAYMPFFELPSVTGRAIVEVQTVLEAGVYRLDLDGIDAAFAAGAGTFVLCNPYNPLGRSFSREEMLGLAAVVGRHGGRVVADEIHAPLTYPGHRHVPYASLSEETASHTVTLTSASKGWNLPGLKCAQVILSNDVDEDCWRTLSVLDTHGASTVGIAANIAAYREGVPWLEAVVDYLRGNRQLLGELLALHLPGVVYAPPEASYLAWLDCRALELDREPADYFLEKARVATNPGLAFGAPGAGHLRFNFATSRSILEQAVESMGAAVNGR